MMATRMSASQEYARLPGDLREHRCAHVRLSPRARDELAELVDAGGIPFDPFLDAFINSAAAMRKELNAQLLEIARKACSQQALPMVGRNEAGDLLLGPIKSECFAETRVGLRRFQFVEALARGKRGYPEHTVQLVQAD